MQCTEISTICPRHGVFVSKRWMLQSGQEISTPCPVCREEREEQIRTQEERDIDFRKKQKEAGIRPRYQRASLDNWIPSNRSGEEARQGLLEYVENFASETKNLVLYGKPSCGKTHVSCALVSALIKQNFSAKYISVHELISNFSDMVVKAGEKEEDFYARLREPDLLVIDDIGLFPLDEKGKMILYRIINERYSLIAPTVLSGRVDPRHLERYIGHPSADRLYEGRAVAIELNGSIGLTDV